MKLSDLIPRRASFKLSITDKEYFLRPVTPGIAMQIEKQIGNLREKLEKGQLMDLFKMAYILMEPESTLDFAKKEVKFVDVEGNAVTENIGGFALFANMISNMDEQFAVLSACLTAMGVSDEAIKELLDKKDAMLSVEIDDEKKENKKKVLKVKKKKK